MSSTPAQLYAAFYRNFLEFTREYHEVPSLAGFFEKHDYDRVAFIALTHTFEREIRKLIKISAKRFRFTQKSRKAAEDLRNTQLAFLAALAPIRDVWIAYRAASGKLDETDFLILDLLYKVRSQRRILRNKKAWDTLIADYTASLEAKDSGLRAEDITSYETLQLQVLAQINYLLIAEPALFNAKVTIAPETLALANLVKAQLHKKLLDKLDLALSGVDQETPFTTFTPDCYRELLPAISTRCCEFLLENPWVTRHPEENPGKTIKAAIVALQSGVDTQAYAWLSAFYQLLEDVNNAPDAISVNREVMVLYAQWQLAEKLPLMLQGLGMEWAIAHEAFCVLLIRACDAVTAANSPKLLAAITKQFLEFLEDKLIEETGKENFYHIVDSRLYFLLIRLMPDAMAVEFKTAIHERLNRYCLNRLASSADITDILLGKVRLEWDGRQHPEDLEANTLGLLDAAVSKKLSQIDPVSMGEEIDKLNRLAVAMARVDARYDLLCRANTALLAEKKQASDVYVRAQLDSAEEFEKEESEYHAQIASMDRARARLRSKYIVFRRQQKLNTLDTTQQNMTDSLQSSLEVAQANQVRLQANCVRLNRQLDGISLQIDGVKLARDDNKFLARTYHALVTEEGMRFKSAVGDAIDRYLAELIKTPEGEDEILRIVHGPTKIVIVLPGGIEFTVQASLKRLYADKLANYIDAVADGEIEAEVSKAAVEKYRLQLTWVEIKRVFVNYINHLELKKDARKNYLNLLHSPVLSVLLQDEALFAQVRDEVKQQAFHSNLFLEIQHYEALFRSVTSYLREPFEAVTFLPHLSAEAAEKLQDFIPRAELQRLHEQSVMAVPLVKPQAQHFYALVMHAFILKMNFKAGMLVTDSVLSAAEVERVLAIYPQYTNHLQAIASFFTLPLQHLQWGQQLVALREGLVALSHYQAEPCFAIIAKDTTILVNQLLAHTQLKLHEMGCYREKYQLIQEVFAILDACHLENQKMPLLMMLFQAFEKWVKVSKAEDLPALFQELHAYSRLVTVFPDSADREMLSHLLSEASLAALLQGEDDSLYTDMMRELNFLISFEDETQSHASLQLENLDKRLFDSRFILLLSFSLSQAQREKLTASITDKLFALPAEVRLLRLLLYRSPLKMRESGKYF